jgi:hypothetical protein
MLDKLAGYKVNAWNKFFLNSNNEHAEMKLWKNFIKII